MDQPARGAQGGEQHGGEGTAANRHAAQTGAGRLADQHGLAENHFGDEAAEEIAAALFRAQAGRAALIEAERPRHRAGQPIDRGAFLGAGGEIGAAQQRGGVQPGAAERFRHERLQRLRQGGDLGGEAGDQGATFRAVFRLQAVEQAFVEAIDEELQFLRKTFDRPRLGLGQGKGHPPDLVTAFPVQIVEEFTEAGNQIGLGEQRIDRHADAEPLLQLLHPAADGAGMSEALVRRRVGNVTQRNGDNHAVQGLARAGAAQQAEEGFPAGAVDARVGILGRVTPGGVDQHGVFGEPPVAQPRAANTGHRALAHFGGEREFQAGVQQRGGFTGTGRANDGVPGLFVEITSGAAGFFQQCECG